MSRLFSLRKVCTAGALCLTLAAAALPAGAATLVVSATKTPGGFDGDALKEANEWVSGFLNSPSDDDKDGKKRARVESAKIDHGQVVIAIKPQ